MPWRYHNGELQVLLVHRPHYDDWSLPKGKLEQGERSLLAAVREIAEETGALVQVGRRLRSIDYPVAGARKSVSYWAMRYCGGEHTPSDEVDRVDWFSIAGASAQLSYESDRAVLDDFASVAVATATVLLIRHAKAGRRTDFRGDDRLRPLDKIGRRQARDSVNFLTAFGPTSVLSANRVRCEQTVAPLAAQLEVTVLRRAEFSDEAYANKPERTMQQLLSLVAAETSTAVCSQGGAIPGLLADLGVAAKDIQTRKGSLWVLSFAKDGLIAADYYPRPQV